MGAGCYQNDITLDDVVKNWTFYPKSIDDITSMNDGQNFTVLEGILPLLNTVIKRVTR
jgi:hypothetical protein